MERPYTPRLSELIALDRYLSEKERQVCPLMNRKKRQRRTVMREEAAAREALQSAAAAMDEKRKDAQYRYSLGDEVQLGTQSYTVLGYDENTVTLSDPKYPPAVGGYAAGRVRGVYGKIHRTTI